MLKSLAHISVSREIPAVSIRDAVFPAPFASGLEYSPPARGAWNIVHTGMLIPESHQIFICARGCLRGVILTAAEMCAMDRMSWTAIDEQDFLGDGLERSVLEGCTHILQKMQKKPRCVLVFFSCVQLFAGVDIPALMEELKRRFPEVDFVDCYMHPTMRKSGLTPDQKMRVQLFDALRPLPIRPRTAAWIGNNLATAQNTESVDFLHAHNWELRDLPDCRTYDEYLKLAEAELLLTTLPAARPAGEILAERLNRMHLHLGLTYHPEEIRKNMTILAEALHAPAPDLEKEEETAEKALAEAKKVLQGMPISIDYTATPRPAGLARLLVEKGFSVERLYLDAMVPEEEPHFRWLQANAPDIQILPTVHPFMRFAPRAKTALAIGQKAAYFDETPHFVNMIEGGGLYGFRGIAELAKLLIRAEQEKKAVEQTIRRKGLGCESCLL
ncbi:MAG: nitrogenase [Lentisphaeria bacterium]|nr:nitrogenase [Lentisphaeria bacterium]